MPHFRVHTLDASGKVSGAGQFDCVNREIALERVKRLAGDLDTELWQLVSIAYSQAKQASFGAT
jgi:hypothetical protein